MPAPMPAPLPGAAFLFADVLALAEIEGDAHAAALARPLRLGVEKQLGHRRSAQPGVSSEAADVQL